MYNRTVIDKTLAADFNNKQELPGLSSFSLSSVNSSLFTPQDIERAIS